MEFQDYENFVKSNHRGVITTYRRNGAGHGSIVVCGAYQGKAAFVIVRGNSVKVGNLRRDNRCTVMAVSEDWRSCAAVEGTSTLMDYHNTDAETMRVELREVFPRLWRQRPPRLGRVRRGDGAAGRRNRAGNPPAGFTG